MGRTPRRTNGIEVVIERRVSYPPELIFMYERCEIGNRDDAATTHHRPLVNPSIMAEYTGSRAEIDTADDHSRTPGSGRESGAPFDRLSAHEQAKTARPVADRVQAKCKVLRERGLGKWTRRRPLDVWCQGTGRRARPAGQAKSISGPGSDHHHQAEQEVAGEAFAAVVSRSYRDGEVGGLWSRSDLFLPHGADMQLLQSD